MGKKIKETKREQAGTMIYMVSIYRLCLSGSETDNHPPLTDGEVKALTSSYLHNEREKKKKDIGINIV